MIACNFRNETYSMRNRADGNEPGNGRPESRARCSTNATQAVADESTTSRKQCQNTAWPELKETNETADFSGGEFPITESEFAYAAEEGDTSSKSSESASNQPDMPTLVAGNIHRQEYREFWEETLQEEKFILDILKHGYKLPFKEGVTPLKYKEKNNKSAIEHAETSHSMN